MSRKFTTIPSSHKRITANYTGRKAYDNAIAPFLSDDSVYDTLFPLEKKILAKAWNSLDYQTYLMGAIDALDLAGITTSDTFNTVADMLIKNWEFPEP